MERCPGCFPENPNDVKLKAAVDKANERSNQNKEPVAIYEEDGEFKLANAFTAYANKWPVRKVVSPYNGTTA